MIATSPDPNYDFDLTYWDTTRYTNWQKVLIGDDAQFSNVQRNLPGGNAITQFSLGRRYNTQVIVGLTIINFVKNRL